MKAHRWRAMLHSCVGIACILAVVPGDTVAYAWSQSPTPAASGTPSTKIPPDQLDSLVAPVALYPDPLLAQVLAASSYPLEIIQLQQWLGKNKGLKDKQLADAVSKEPWDPSVQALAALPDVVKRLADDIAWTTDLGNAFLAQQSDVMDAVQRMRKKAQEKGNLKTTEQQKVETQVIESKQVIVIEPANPQVVYVPTYSPVVVYGPPIYPYPPIYYPPAWYYPAGIAISFGVGMAMGAFWGAAMAGAAAGAATMCTSTTTITSIVIPTSMAETASITTCPGAETATVGISAEPAAWEELVAPAALAESVERAELAVPVA